jgi:hypothetical protein
MVFKRGSIMARQYLDLAQVYGAVDQSRANQANQEAQRMQMENARYQQQRQMSQDQLQERKRGIGANAIKIGEDGKPTIDRQKYIADMLGVDAEEALTRQAQFDTQDAATAKAQREAQKEELAFQADSLKQARDIAASIYDDASFEQAKPLLAKIAPQMPLPDRFDTKWRDNITLTAEGRLKQIESQLGRDVTMRGQDLSSNTARRGQDLSASTARRGQDITANNAAQRLNFDRSGGVAAVNAKNGTTTPKSEKLTEGMRNNAMYAQRMTAAEKLLGDTTEQKPGVMETIAGGAPLIGSELGANQMRSPDRQKAVQAQRDWVRAKLRKESGAAIGVDEMNQEISTYFPQIGDSPDVIAQKKIAREQATDGLIQSSGSAYSPPAERQAPIMSKADAKMPQKPLATVKSDNDYNKLPKGTRFKAPDGSIRVKK